MKLVALSQRVAVDPVHGERRDCLDQAWARFLAACGLAPLALPNVEPVALALLGRHDVAGLLLTGGNDLGTLGGDAPERDRTELALLEHAERRALPVIGVCRGMQVLQLRWGIALKAVSGHVQAQQEIAVGGLRAQVNSYHRFGTDDSRAPLEVWARADDGIVKAVRHASLPVTGIMWHPERIEPFASADIALFRRTFAPG
jgi:putative glutamine amidotransferase